MKAPTGGRATAPLLADFIALNEQIAALARARVPLESHLVNAAGQLPGSSGELVERIGRRLEAGENLAAAMDAECGSLPASYRAAIVAGVESGRLGSVLQSLVESASRIDQMRRVTGAALLYPLILIVVACVLLAVVLTVVVPTFWWLGQYQSPLVEWLAEWPLTLPALAAVVPILIILAAGRWWWRSGRLGSGREAYFGPAGWLPAARRVRHWSQVAAFAEMLHLLIARELPLGHALRLAAEATDDAPLRDAALRLASEIEQGGAAAGGNVSVPHRGLPLLVRLALHHTADRALLAGSLRRAADMYRQRAIRAAEWYAEYVPILLTVAIGGALTVGFAMFVFWPYASVLHELSDWHWQ